MQNMCAFQQGASRRWNVYRPARTGVVRRRLDWLYPARLSILERSMNRLNALATILVLMMPAVHAATAKLVIHNGERRQEIIVTPFSVTLDPARPGMIIDVTSDVIMSNGFDQRAPPDTLRAPQSTTRKVKAMDGTEAPVKGIGERRATVG